LKNLSEIIKQKYLILDGAYGTEFQKLDVPSSAWGEFEGCWEYLNLSAPNLIEGVHLSYLEAGADIIKANSFGALPWVLDEFGLGSQTYEINLEAAKIAKKCALKYEDRFVTASLGPGTKLPTLGHISFEEMEEGYYIAGCAHTDGGSDIFLLETCQDPLQIKAALLGLQRAMSDRGKKLPVMVSVTIETFGTMLVGTPIGVVAKTLEPFELFSIGINCGLGPKEVRGYLEELSLSTTKPISIHANAGLPENVGGCTVYPMDKDEFRELEGGFFDIDGVAILGGCCGTTPEHIRELKKASTGKTPKPNRFSSIEPSLTSIFQDSKLNQEIAPLLVAERTNATGSKAFRELLLKEDFEGILDVAQGQVASGAHALDISVGFAGRDEESDLKKCVEMFNNKIALPLMIDSTQPKALESALKRVGGKPIINSANLEDGEERFDEIASLAKKYGAALVCLTIDEDGMAKSCAKKVEIAKRMHKRATELIGLDERDLVFDLLTFTLGSGDEEFFRAGVETIDAIEELHKLYPNIGFILGLSNISFGLDKDARKYLNSVFLYHCVQKGLSAAILNTAHILPYSSMKKEDIEACEKLIFNEQNSSKPLFAFINHFSQKVEEVADSGEEKDTQTLLREYLINGQKEKMLKLLEACKDEINPEDIINNHLIEGMKEIGEMFGKGEMQLPFVLQSAEVMKASVDYLNAYLPKKEKKADTTIVLGTVKGDVHDVGKNLVDIILTNNGFRVINIGIKADISEFIAKAKEFEADALGMSGLLVKSTKIMSENLEHLKKEGLNTPVLLGGAALNRKFVDEYCRSVYDGEVFYCKDAFDGLKAMQMIEKGESQEINHKALIKVDEQKEVAGEHRYAPLVDIAPKDIAKPPFYRKNELVLEDLETPFRWLNLEHLFRKKWGFFKKGMSKAQFEKLKAEQILPLYERIKEEFLRGLFDPVILYGYHECRRVKNSVVIKDGANEYALEFPREKKEPFRCLADYFREDKDIIGVSVVSSGVKLKEHCAKMYKDGEYSNYYFYHMLSIELAEALADVVHKKFRIDLGLEDGGLDDVKKLNFIGQRYSFGYSMCPDMEYNRVLFDLLSPQEYGIELTESFLIDPEASTSALITRNEHAKYFNP
jgi:5-methyltetrahydrofolate--homocysteine methyltransferase